MTSFSDRPMRRLAMAALACGLLLSAAACGGDDDDAPTNSAGDGGGAASGGESGGGSGSEESAGTPQDSELDIQARSDDGVTMSLSSIAFEGDNILVDVEFVNGSAQGDVEVHNTTWDETALRLVDVEGNVYNFLQPEDAESENLALAQGESLNGTLEFLGPLVTETDQLYLVTNVDTDAEAYPDWEPSVRCGHCGSGFPGLVAEIPLEWG